MQKLVLQIFIFFNLAAFGQIKKQIVSPNLEIIHLTQINFRDDAVGMTIILKELLR